MNHTIRDLRTFPNFKTINTFVPAWIVEQEENQEVFNFPGIFRAISFEFQP